MTPTKTAEEIAIEKAKLAGSKVNTSVGDIGKVEDNIDPTGRPIEPEAKSTQTFSPGLSVPDKNLNIKEVTSDVAPALAPPTTTERELLVKKVDTASMSPDELRAYEENKKNGPVVVTADFIARARAKQIVIQPFDYIVDVNSQVTDKDGKNVKTTIDASGNTVVGSDVIETTTQKIEKIRAVLKMSGADSVQVERGLNSIKNIVWGI